MSQRVIGLLKERNKKAESPFVFPSNSKTGHLTTVEKAFVSARRQAGVSEEIVLYCARHRFATDALAGTGNLALVMRTLGHANAQTAMIYQHPSIESVREVIDRRNATVVTSQTRHKVESGESGIAASA